MTSLWLLFGPPFFRDRRNKQKTGTKELPPSMAIPFASSIADLFCPIAVWISTAFNTVGSEILRLFGEDYPIIYWLKYSC